MSPDQQKYAQRVLSQASPMEGKPSLQIHVAVGNRWTLASPCIENLIATSPPWAEIHVWLDSPGISTVGTVELTSDRKFTLHTLLGPIGIERQRALHVRWWSEHPTAWLYFTDADAVHAPGWFELLRAIHISSGALACGYRTFAHRDSVIAEIATCILHKFVPGISMLMSGLQALSVAHGLGQQTEFRHPGGRGGFDWEIPRLLNHYCAVSKFSVVDHVGKGGMHHPPGQDAPGDRAAAPMDPLPALVSHLWPLADLP